MITIFVSTELRESVKNLINQEDRLNELVNLSVEDADAITIKVSSIIYSVMVSVMYIKLSRYNVSVRYSVK